MTNPLLDFSGLPRFGSVGPEHIEPAVDELVSAGRATIERVAALDASPTWESFVEPLDDANERLARMWAQASHLNAVANTPAMRDAYNAALPKVTQYFSEQGQDQRLHAGFKALRASPGFDSWPRARRRHVENELRDFRLGGAELPPPEKAQFLAIQEELAKLGAKFSENVLDATNAFGLYVTDAAELAGLPEDVHGRGGRGGEGGRARGLEAHAADALLPAGDAIRGPPRPARADVRGQRDARVRAGKARVEQRRQHRAHPGAAPRGGATARLSPATRTSRSPPRWRRRRRRRWSSSTTSRRARGPLPSATWRRCATSPATSSAWPRSSAWDVSYASEKLRQQRYAFSEQEVKHYFTEDEVLAGHVPRGEGDLRARSAARPGRALPRRRALLRDHRRGGQPGGPVLHGPLRAREQARRARGWTTRSTAAAWASACRPRSPSSPAISRPRSSGNPALFTHREVTTLFHEFGHGLHQLLTQVDELGVSGINGVEWDAVELPSQFMENFCWEWDVVAPMTRHVESGARMPRELFDKLLAAKNFQSGMRLRAPARVRDLRHAPALRSPPRRAPEACSPCSTTCAARWRSSAFRRTTASPTSSRTSSRAGTRPGYYSYKWAEVLSSDAFGAFEEAGVLNPEVGARFRREVLACGGSRPALESFVAFRGRKPQIDALLRHNGMTATA